MIARIDTSIDREIIRKISYEYYTTNANKNSFNLKRL